MIVRRPSWLRWRRAGDGWWQVGSAMVAVAAVTTALLALALHRFATPWQATIALTAVSHQLMWAAPFGVAFAALARRWATAAVALVACGLVGIVQLPPLLRTPHPGRGRSLVILQANLAVGHADASALTKLVRDNHVDLLATEELTFAAEAALVRAGLADLLRYRYTAALPDGGGGLGMWSRFRLSDTHNLPGYTAGVLTARVDVGFTFVAAHLSPPYKQPVHIWRREIGTLRGVLAGQPGDAPVLVAGDFNATVDHAQFRALLTGGYHDAADQAGAGYLPTYPADRWWGPLIGIDHVLMRGGAVATSAKTFSLRRSDHRALLVRVVLPR